MDPWIGLYEVGSRRKRRVAATESRPVISTACRYCYNQEGFP